MPQGIDADGDGRFEALVVTAKVDGPAGSVIVTADLVADGQFVTSLESQSFQDGGGTLVDLTGTGPTTVILHLSGGAIRRSDGAAYEVGLSLTDLDYSFLNGAVTGPGNLDPNQFGEAPADLLSVSTSYRDAELVVATQVHAYRPGDYTVSAVAYSADGRQVAIGQTTQAVTAAGTISVALPVFGSSGPLTVSVQLIGPNYEFLGSTTTDAPAYTPSAPPGVGHFLVTSRRQLLRLGSAGDTTLVGTLPFTPFDLAISSRGVAYALANEAGSSVLYRLTLSAAGVGATRVGPLGVFANALDVRSDGTLVAAGNNRLFRVNPATGAVTLLSRGPQGTQSAGDLASGPGGEMYLTADSSGGQLIRVSPDLKRWTVVGSTGVSGLGGLRYLAGWLIGYGTGGAAYQIHPATGAATLISNLGDLGSVVGFATGPFNGISLSAASVPENRPAGSEVAKLRPTFVSAGEVITHTLVAGAGSGDNARFRLDGDRLVTAASFDFETRRAYSVRIRSVSSAGWSLERVYTLGVVNVAEAPTALTLTGTSVPELRPSGITVGVLSAIDPDGTKSFTYALVAGPGDDDNSAFRLAGNRLLTAGPLDFGVGPTRTIRVRVSDAGGLSAERVFTLTVRDDPVLSLVGRTLTATGTAGPDVFSFRPGATRHTLTFAGVTRLIEASAFDAVVIEAGGGLDRADLAGSAGEDTLDVGPGGGKQIGPGYEVRLSGVENIVARGGFRDFAHLHDSPGNDLFIATPTDAVLSGPGYRLQASGFTAVYAHASAGGVNTARLTGSSGNDQLTATPTYAYFYGPGFFHEALGFDSVSVVAGAGTDRATLQGSASDDWFTGSGRRGSLRGSGYEASVIGFDSVNLQSQGGMDRKRVAVLDYLFTLEGTWLDA